MRAVEEVAGAILVAVTWLSILRTVFTPGGMPSLLARWTTRALGKAMVTTARRWPPSSARDAFLGYACPLMLFAIGVAWLAASGIGFMFVFWGATGHPANLRSYSLGTAGSVIAEVALASTLLLLAAFTTHLVNVTSAQNRREQLVCRLAALAASSPDADMLLAEYARHGESGQLGELFAHWSGWLADVRATHLAYPPLVYYRSSCELSWPQAVQIVLDCAALADACAPNWSPPETAMLLKSGAVCIPRIAELLGIELPPVAVSHQGREMLPFDSSLRSVHSAGLILETTADEAQRVFNKHRVRYAPFTTAISERLLYSDADS